MTPRAQQILRILAEHADDPDSDLGEIVEEGRIFVLGTDRVMRNTVGQLHRCLALREVQRSGDIIRWAINDTGRALMRRPSLELAIHAAVARQRAFTIHNDRVVLLVEPGPLP